jgi:hypothetical protein
MRPLLAVLVLAAILSPAFAQDRDTYENIRYGYVLDIPAGFRGEGEADNGDGQLFRPDDGTRELRVYGRTLMIPEFERAAEDSITYHSNEGWAVTYKRVTPSWASYSGTRNGLVLYVRMIALCGEDQSVSAELTYPERDIAAMDEVVELVVSSLKPTGRGAGC